MTGQSGWGLTSQIGCRRPQWMTHGAPPPTHLRNCWAPLWAECHNKCPTYAAWWWKGAQAKWLNFSPHYCAAQFLHNFQPFCWKPGKGDANVFLRRQTATSYFYFYRRNLRQSWVLPTDDRTGLIKATIIIVQKWMGALINFFLNWVSF